MKGNNFFWGMLLVLIGVMALTNNILGFRIFDMESLWPCFVLIPGLCFEFGYFSNRRNPGVLVPGGILTTLGLLFFFETLTRWNFSEYTWPIYPLAVAVGLFQLYLFGERNRGLLVPVGILTAVSVISFISIIYGNLVDFLGASIVIPVILILFGIWIIFNGIKKNR